MLNFGILGNNARNLHYIKKFNDKKAIRLANNKLETKKFLSERGIPFAKTYAIIKSRSELFDFNFSELPKKEFVVKPNQGSQGKGIYLVKGFKTTKKQGDIENETIKSKISEIISSLKSLYLTPSPQDGYFTIGDEQVPDSEFRRYLIDILSGRHSLSAGNDKIILEEKLSPGASFKDFCAHGLADIRVIVFNLVPVAAMIRIPTVSSGGKANLAQGGLGLGIEIGTGKITSMLHKNKILTSNFPEEYAHFFGKKIPYRNDILFYSSKVQFFVNLGYLALDRVITNDGPKLLEINARAGLEVQNVSNIKLKKILEKISDLKVIDPEKGVEIAKSLFAVGKTNPHAGRVLYLSQNGKITFKSNDTEHTLETIVEVNLNNKENLITKNLADKLKEGRNGKFTLDLYDNEILLKDIKLKSSPDLKENKIVIGKETASAFLIKPIHKIFESTDILNPKKIILSELDQLRLIDQRVANVGRKLILAPKLRPLNYFEELDNFITRNGKYDPRFRYKMIDESKYNDVETELMAIQETLSSPDLKSEFKNLFVEKLEELSERLHLLRAYKSQDFKNILHYNKKLFGEFDEELLKISKEKVFSNISHDKGVLGRILTPKEIHEEIEKHLLEKGIYGVNIVAHYTNLSRISITMGKRIRINIGNGAIFREKELKSILAHEVDTHLIRYINGMKSGWEIFKSGTGYYLKDEEGLAVWNANQILPEGYEKLSIYKKYFLIKESMNYSFRKTVELISFLYPEHNLEKLFKNAIRVKRGIQDTSIINPGSTFLKDKIYMDGYAYIQKHVEDGLDTQKLNKGKMKIIDLDFII